MEVATRAGMGVTLVATEDILEVMPATSMDGLPRQLAGKIFRTSRGKASSPAGFCGTQLCIVMYGSTIRVQSGVRILVVKPNPY